MPVGEFVGEVIVRFLLEVVLYGIFYWTGAAVLKVGSCGKLRLAPLSAIHEENRGKKRWYQIDWSIWLGRGPKGRALKAEWVCVVGFFVWVLVGVGIYFAVRPGMP